LTPLEDLLQQCKVKITVPGGWGTGFFVAPGLILTCAHVVRKAADLQVTVFYPAWQQPLSAVVKARADDGRTLDLALVELSEPLYNHPCVLLDEEPVAIGQALYSYGYLESYTNAAPVRPVSEGWTGDTPPLLKLQGAQIEHGISGAALLNLKTGKVCGMVKETRAAGFDLGGGAIPTRVILEQFPELRELQQQAHQHNRKWLQRLAAMTADATPAVAANHHNTRTNLAGVHMSLGGQHQKWGGTDTITVNLQNEDFCPVQVMRCSVHWKTVDGSARYQLKPNRQIRWIQKAPWQDGSGSFFLPKMLKQEHVIQLSFKLRPQDIQASGIDTSKYVESLENELMASSLIYEAFAEVITESNHVMSGSISFFYPRDKDKYLSVLLNSTLEMQNGGQGSVAQQVPGAIYVNGVLQIIEQNHGNVIGN
jgi:hypothetical protein